MSLQETHEEQYRRVLEHVRRDVAYRRRTDPQFTIAHLEGMLETHYVLQGNDWTGRGRVAEIEIAATIAAFEDAITEWRRELEQEGDDAQ